MKTPLPPAVRMAASRRRNRQQGLRLVSIWIPDVRNPDFVQLARQQCLALKDNPHEHETAGWLEKLADDRGWEV